MTNEYEIISHSNTSYDIFLNEMLYRTPHFHKDFEIGFLLRGKLKITTADETLFVKENDLWIINPFLHHEYEAQGEPTLILIIQINPAFFSSYYSIINNITFATCAISLDKPEYKDLYEAMISIATHFFHQEARYELQCAALLNYIFERLMRFIPYTVISEFERKAKKSRLNLIRKITAYIDENYYHKLLLTDIAEETNLTVNYLSHFFKDSMGVSFQKYLAKIRCHRAAVLLCTTSLSLIDISISCGFSDSKYFTKNFREYYGIHPHEFRKFSSFDQSSMIVSSQGQGGGSATAERRQSLNVSRKTLDYYYNKLENPKY